MRKEFEFYDEEYFKFHGEARINFYYSGHGKEGGIQVSDFVFKYDEAIVHIIESANQ